VIDDECGQWYEKEFESCGGWAKHLTLSWGLGIQQKVAAHLWS